MVEPSEKGKSMSDRQRVVIVDETLITDNLRDLLELESDFEVETFNEPNPSSNYEREILKSVSSSAILLME